MSAFLAAYLGFLAMGLPLVLGALFVGIAIGMAIQRYLGVDLTTPPTLYRAGGGHDGIDTGPNGPTISRGKQDHSDLRLRDVSRRERGQGVPQAGEPNPRDVARPPQLSLGQQLAVDPSRLPSFGLQTLEGSDPASPEPADGDFESMLAGYDRIIHDKALQQELLDAGLLVKVDPATGELIEGSDPASPEAPDDIEKAYWVGRDVGRMEMRQDIARAQLNCQHQVLGCINCGKPFGHGDTPSAALAASESSHG